MRLMVGARSEPMTDKEDAELIDVIEELDRAYGEAPHPPPHFDEVLREASQVSTGVSEEELESRRSAFLLRMGMGRSLGELLRGRREAMHLGVEEMSRRASWPAHRLEELEANRSEE